MNEIQFYSIIMFFAGVAITHAVFYFDLKQKRNRFYILMSAAILQVLDSVYTTHMSAFEFIKTETKTVEDSQTHEYLDTELAKISVFMEIYILLLTKAVPKEGRKYVKYKTWPEAQTLIKELRGLSDDIKR